MAVKELLLLFVVDDVSHAHGSRVGVVSPPFVCLFFAYDIWKETDAASMIKLDVEMFHDEFFKAI